MAKLLLLLAQLFAVGLCYHENNCNRGSDYWCKSYETAVKCGVLAYCKLKSPLFPSSNAESTNHKLANLNTDPVKIDLYYEGQCGGCRKFIMEQLTPTFKSLEKTGILSINLYPYGNARETNIDNTWRFDCQHGEEECKMNILETCAIHILKDPSQYLPYIDCVETGAKFSYGKICANECKVDWESLSECYNGKLGNSLEHEMALKTAALSPRHTYVPWITVNGVHTEDLQFDAQCGLFNLVCKMYKGVKPKECQATERCLRSAK